MPRHSPCIQGYVSTILSILLISPPSSSLSLPIMHLEGRSGGVVAMSVLHASCPVNKSLMMMIYADDVIEAASAAATNKKIQQ